MKGAFLCNEQAHIPRTSHLEKDNFCKWNIIYLQWANNYPKKIMSWQRSLLQIEHNFFAMNKQTSQENHILGKIISANETAILCNEQANIPRNSHIGKDYFCTWNINYLQWANNSPKKIISWQRSLLQIEQNFFAMSKQTS